MKLRITRRGAWSLGLIALTMRLFVAIAIDQPNLLVSGWMSALLGGLLSAPMQFAAGYISRQSSRNNAIWVQTLKGFRPLVKAMELLFAVLLLFESVDTIGLIALLADYTTMTSLQASFLIVPLVAALFMALLNNGEGIGGAARLWRLVVPSLLLIVFLQHLKTYNLRWLTPILGSGYRSIASGAVSAGGALAPAALLWLAAEPETSDQRSGMNSLVVVPVLVGALLLVLHAAMTPAQISGSDSRLFQLDSVISNGRAALATQLPMTLVWFAGLLFTLAFELFLAALYLQRVFERIDGKLCVASICTIAAALVLSGWQGHRAIVFLTEWEYLLVSVPILLTMLLVMLQKRRSSERK